MTMGIKTPRLGRRTFLQVTGGGIAALGVSIYVVFYFIGKRWASWEA